VVPFRWAIQGKLTRDGPHGLIEKLHKGEVIPFVGAGVSRAVTDLSGQPLFPSWPELLARAVERLRADQNHKKANRAAGELEDNDYLAAAKTARDGLGADWFPFLNSQFDLDLTPARDLRNDMKLVASDDTEGQFSVFMRKSGDFPENFSIGLIYHPADSPGEITLVRCNGQHGEYNGGPGDPSDPHWHYHVHQAQEVALDAGERAEKYAVKTDAYASFEEAVQYFLKTVNLDEKESRIHFPTKVQSILFE